jgi:hypothetical protein
LPEKFYKGRNNLLPFGHYILETGFINTKKEGQKMKRRFWTLLLAVCCMAMLFVGCSAQKRVEKVETLEATVLEVRENSLLVEEQAGAMDEIVVPTEGVPLPDGLTQGAEILITYAGGIGETYPAQLFQVQAITLIDAGED